MKLKTIYETHSKSTKEATTNSVSTNQDLIEDSSIKLIHNHNNKLENLDKIYKTYIKENKIGNIIVLFWRDNKPFINIGPDCKQI